MDLPFGGAQLGHVISAEPIESTQPALPQLLKSRPLTKVVQVFAVVQQAFIVQFKELVR